MLKRNIHVIAAGCTFNAASSPIPPKIIPSPPVIVNPITIVGIVSLTGGAAGAGSIPVFNERFAPHLLQYFTSTVISLPQLGQYIRSPLHFVRRVLRRQCYTDDVRIGITEQVRAQVPLTFSNKTRLGTTDPFLLAHGNSANAVRFALPNEDHFALKLFSNSANARLIRHESTILFRPASNRRSPSETGRRRYRSGLTLASKAASAYSPNVFAVGGAQRPSDSGAPSNAKCLGTSCSRRRIP